MNNLIETPSESYLRTAPDIPNAKESTRTPEKKRAVSKWRAPVIMLSIIIVLATACVILFNGGLGSAIDALKNSYFDAYSNAKKETHDEFYNKVHDAVEKKYHLSNRMEISIANIDKTAKLEVLKATDTEYIIENEDDNEYGITSWLKAEGEGTYIVDLQTAEFIVDNERCHVLVRIPRPELTSIGIVKTEICLFDDSWGNENYAKGTDFSIDQYNKAATLIEKSLRSNQYFYEAAETAALRSVTNLVKQFNPNVPGLTIDVEFTS